LWKSVPQNRNKWPVRHRTLQAFRNGWLDTNYQTHSSGFTLRL
jgi:hypothetical protein